MKTIGPDWLALKPDELSERDLLRIRDVPGVAILLHNDRIQEIQVHRSHLVDPLLPGMSVFPETPTMMVLGQPLSSRPYVHYTPGAEEVAYDFHGPDFRGLRDYQIEAVKFATSRHGSLLLHDMGQGKSRMALRSACAPALVLTPNSGVQVWQREADQNGWRFYTLIGKGAPAVLDRCAEDGIDLFIITYGSSAMWLGYFKEIARNIPIHTMIADEAHMLHRLGLQWSQAFQSVPRQRTLCLTATPMRNRLVSLWGILNAACPRAWGSKLDFRKRYCGAVQNEYGWEDGEATNIAELAARLETVAIRETWQSPRLAHYRPVLRRQVVRVPVEMATIVDDRKTAAFASRFRGHDASRAKVNYLAMLSRVRKSLSKYKLDKVKTMAKDLMVEHGRVVFWVWYKDMARDLAGHLEGLGYEVDVLTGEAPTKKRANILEQWADVSAANLRRPRAVVCALAAGYACINLVSAQAAVFVEYDWTPMLVQQAEKRHHRFGNPNKDVVGIYFVVPNSEESRMVNVLLDKIVEADSVVPDADALEQFGVLVKREE